MQGLHYYICVRVDVLSKHVSTLVQYLSDKQHVWWDIVLCPTIIFHTGLFGGGRGDNGTVLFSRWLDHPTLSHNNSH